MHSTPPPVDQECPALAPAAILALRLRDDAAAWLVLSPRCSCGVALTTDLGVHYLAKQLSGNPTLGEAVARLRCEACGGRPARVEVRDERGSWRVELTGT